MSWLTEIAGKAEDLLNRVDQSAATALQNKTKSSVYNPDSPFHKSGPYLKSGSVDYASGSTFSSPSPLRSVSSTSSLAERKLSSPRKKPESDDEKLIRFLNSNDSELGAGSENKPAHVKKVDSSIIENVPVKMEGMAVKDYDDSDIHSKNPESEEAVHDHLKHPLESLIKSVPDGGDQNLSSEEEIRSAKKRAENAETEMRRMAKRMDHWNSQISGNDKVARELRERERDLIAAMDAKDSQLAVLKVRLQEADQELTRKSHIIEGLQTENDRIVKDHAQTAATQNKTIEVLQEQFQEMRNELKKARELAAQSQMEHMQKVDKMEEERRHLAESYSSVQKRKNELNERTKDLMTQLKHSNNNLDILQQEYSDYKQKAQRILQSKEKLISSLKEGHLDTDNLEKSEAASLLLNAEVEGMKQERDLLRDELRRANELTETYRVEVQELEKMSQGELMMAEGRHKTLQEQMDMERVQKEEMQLHASQYKEEVQFLQEDLNRTKSTFQSRIQDREIEIEKLRRQLTAKSLSSVSQDELESRLHALTENLIQKQTLVESLSTEKNSLVLQLERLERQLREAQNCGVQQHAYVGINNNEQERKSKTVFLENPFDSSLTRKVKRVYGSIDALSIRLGVFFRRYPIARVFVFIYMLLLHFWVMIVLLTYEPEVHNVTYDNLKDS